MSKRKGVREINNDFLDHTRQALKQQEAAHRLAQLMRALAEPPEPFLNLLGRLEVPYQVSKLPFADDDEYDCIIIRVKDLEAGEERNQKQGSRLQRLYADQVKPEVIDVDLKDGE